MPLAPDFLDHPLSSFLDAIGREARAPGGGSIAALAAAMSASLTAKAARSAATTWAEGGGSAAQAEALHARLLALVAADAEAYEAAMEALRGPRVGDAASRDAALAAALTRAAEVPAAIAEAAADVAVLAAGVADSGDPDLRADAAIAVILAEAAAAAAAHLVEVNLATSRDDARLAGARAAADTAADARLRALARDET